MNRTGSFISAALVAAIPFLPLTASDQQDKQDDEKGKRKSLKIQSNYHEFEIPEIDLPPIKIDLSELEFSLKRMEVALAALEDCHIPELAFELSEIPPIEIPEINIPPIPPIEIPPIAIPPIVIPDLALGDLSAGCDVAAHQIFHGLSDEEQVRLQALRTLACKGPDQAINAYQEVQKQKARPAFRYEAIRQLGHFLDDARVLPLIADAAKSDKNIEVRKKAIGLLGKSRDPRSTKILEEILMN